MPSTVIIVIAGYVITSGMIAAVVAIAPDVMAYPAITMTTVLGISIP
jgi:hypothetical protein